MEKNSYSHGSSSSSSSDRPPTVVDYMTSPDDVIAAAAAADADDVSDNVTETSTADPRDPWTMMRYPTWATVLIILACAVIMVGTVFGNFLVVTAVSIVRKLRTPSNWLIVSLAVADLCVALLVMPLATMYEVMGVWAPGQTVCDVWTSLDVMLCTASILNLCMISVDRYFVITRPFQYAMKRTPLLMALMVLFVWLLSALISIPPLFGWKDPPRPFECQLSQAIGYQFYATIGAFYLPLAVMVFIYYRIYTVSARLLRAEAKTKRTSDSSSGGRRPSYLPPPASRKCSLDVSGHQQHGHHNNRLEVVNNPEFRTSTSVGGGGGSTGSFGMTGAGEGRSYSRSNSVDLSSPKTPLRKTFSFLQRGGGGAGGGGGSHRLSSASRERKTTKTLGVIMGAFVACWLPFFILALVRPFLADQSAVPDWLASVLLWLGYTNSFLNPIIYARFNRDFRTPFKEILLGRCGGINVRLRSESYTEQYGPAAAQDSSRVHDQVGSKSTLSAATTTTTTTTATSAGPRQMSLSGVPEDVTGSDGCLYPPVFITLSDEDTRLNHERMRRDSRL